MTDPVAGPRRRSLLGKAGAVGSVALAGCLNRLPIGGRVDSDETTTAKPDDSTPRIGMIYGRGGLRDWSYNDAAYQGIQQATLDFDVEFTNREPGTGDEFSAIQNRLAASVSPSYALICCIGFSQRESLVGTAATHPDQRFMIVDAVVDADNVASYVFEEHEGSFLVGQLAGLLTTRPFDHGGGTTDPERRTVGFVGGEDTPPIRKFHAGYRAGVEYADEDVEVLSAYVGRFDDPDRGEEVATAMFDSGADIVYHAAGRSGVGVLRAAQWAGRYALGVDVDQSRHNPQYADVVLASMTKQVDVAVYSAVSDLVDDALRTGDVVRFGLERDGVGISYGATLGDAIPESVTSAIEDSRRRIVDGGIDVPSTVDDR